MDHRPYQTVSTRSLKAQRVLIVDHDLSLSRSLAVTLRRAGAAPVWAVANIDGAMSILASEAVDAVLCDISIGPDATFELALICREKGVRVVFVAGHDDWFLPEDPMDELFYFEAANRNALIHRLSKEISPPSLP